jgi:hypothetical protein
VTSGDPRPADLFRKKTGPAGEGRCVNAADGRMPRKYCPSTSGSDALELLGVPGAFQRKLELVDVLEWSYRRTATRADW